MLQEYLLVGHVAKAQGTRGQVKIKPETDDPMRFLDLNTLYVRKAGSYLPWPIEDVSVRDGMVYATLNGAINRDQAEAQRSTALYVSRVDAVQLPEDSHFIADLIGCRVYDKAGGLIGELKGVLQPGSADVYVITTATGRMLLPALKKVVLEVEPEERRIVIDEALLPEVAVIED